MMPKRKSLDSSMSKDVLKAKVKKINDKARYHVLVTSLKELHNLCQCKGIRDQVLGG